MKGKRYAIGLVGGVLLYSMMAFSVPTQSYGISVEHVVQAEELGDDLSGSAPRGTSSEEVPDNGVGDLFKGYEAMTKEQLAESTEKVSPITNIFGYIIGAVVALTAGAIFVITAFDLAYIAIPPIRPLLYKGAPQQGGGMMGGYGGGYGGRGMYGGGMMGGGMQQQQPSSGFHLISDEAIQCSMLMGGAQQGGMMQGGMAGGMYGGGMMGGMQQQQPQMSTRSVIGTYFKKRVFFMILFAICTAMLTTSLFLNTGINLAMWFTKLVEMINGSIPR